VSWLPVTTIVEPSDEPVTLAEAKANAFVDGNDRDERIAAWIAQARARAEEYTGTRVMEQMVLLRCSSWADLCRLPIAPVRSVTVKYLDADNAEQTLDPLVYELVSAGVEASIRLAPGEIYPAIRNASDAIRIEAVVGYDEGDHKLELIKDAIASHITRKVDDPAADYSAGFFSLLGECRRFA
jgi:uncharacterized phiE125 gp8 family phage protein